MTHARGSRPAKRKVFFLEPQGHIYHADQDRHFHQRADDCGKCHTRINAEYGYSHGNGKFKIVGRRGKTQGCGLFIGRTCLHGQIKGYEKHDDKVDAERYGHANHIQRKRDNILALERKHHQDRKQQGDECNWADLRNEFFFIPLAAFCLESDHAGDDAGDKGDAQIDKNALCNLPDGYIDHGALYRRPLREYCNKDVCVKGKKQDLEDGVKCHKPCAVLRVSRGQIIPHDNHGNTAGQPDHDQAHHIFVMAAEKGNGEQEHQDGADHPVLDQGKCKHFKITKYVTQLLIPHLGKGRVHHQDQSDGNGDIGGAHLKMIDHTPDIGEEITTAHADKHGQEYPEG